MYLKIPFYPHLSTFGRDEDYFPFSSKISYAHLLYGIPPKNKNKKLYHMCYCDVQTMQTKPTMYNQCRQNWQDFAEKSSSY